MTSTVYDPYHRHPKPGKIYRNTSPPCVYYVASQQCFSLYWPTMKMFFFQIYFRVLAGLGLALKIQLHGLLSALCRVRSRYLGTRVLLSSIICTKSNSVPDLDIMRGLGEGESLKKSRLRLYLSVCLCVPISRSLSLFVSIGLSVSLSL